MTDDVSKQEALSPWGEGRGEGDIFRSRKPPPRVVRRAKNLRRDSTDAEKVLWRYLRNRILEGFKFRRQHMIGPYIVDFVCLEACLVVELDGGQHMDRQDYDEKRSAFLRDKGFSILRFWNNDIFQNIEGVLHSIRGVLMAPSPNPLPGGERAFMSRRGDGQSD